MPRSCTICIHTDRYAIEKAAVDGTPNRRIAAQFGIAETSLRRHIADHLSRDLAKNAAAPVAPVQPAPAPQPASIDVYAARRQADDRAHAVDIFAELLCQLDRVNTLSDAVDAWLRDPEDPTRYDISARAEEITVVYDDLRDCRQDGSPRRKRGRLSDLLEQVQTDSRGVIEPISGETKVADPRELLLKAHDSLKGQMQLRVTLLEKLYSAQQIELFQEAVLTAIAEVAPDVRSRILDNLRRRQPLRGLPVAGGS